MPKHNTAARHSRGGSLVLVGGLIAASALAGCLSGQRVQSRESRRAFATAPSANLARLDAPQLPTTMFAYVAGADSALARLSRAPGFQGGRGRGGGAGGAPGAPLAAAGNAPPPAGPGNGGRGGRGGRGGFGRARDNSPIGNPVTDAGATLGRVLFYDQQLSANNHISCASCHVQAFGFADTARLSHGFAGGLTKRHSMALANARLYANGRFFWDERAGTLETQVLMPVQDLVEMGMTLPALETKLSAVSYYAPLFAAAFGSTEITSDRISRALAQFVRSLISSQSRFDTVAAGALTAQEREGLRLFNGQGGCSRCHVGAALAGDGAHNTGLDAAVTDSGAGRGRFKVPSLRNVAVRAPYMHDGRFTTLAQVVDHYNGGVKDNPSLDQRLRGRGASPRGLGLSASQKDAIVAYMQSLTDTTFLNAVKFSDPFVPVRVASRGSK